MTTVGGAGAPGQCATTEYGVEWRRTIVRKGRVVRQSEVYQWRLGNLSEPYYGRLGKLWEVYLPPAWDPGRSLK